MKVKVLKKFRDKYTKKIYKVDSVIEITKERFEEILKVDKLVEMVAEDPGAEPKVAETKKKPAKKAENSKENR